VTKSGLFLQAIQDRIDQGKLDTWVECMLWMGENPSVLQYVREQQRPVIEQPIVSESMAAPSRVPPGRFVACSNMIGSSLAMITGVTLVVVVSSARVVPVLGINPSSPGKVLSGLVPMKRIPASMICVARPSSLKVRRLRKHVETVGAHLTERFGVARIRVHDLWHYQHRLIRKALAHTVAVFLNLQLGRPPLNLGGLVAL